MEDRSSNNRDVERSYFINGIKYSNCHNENINDYNITYIDNGTNSNRYNCSNGRNTIIKITTK